MGAPRQSGRPFGSDPLPHGGQRARAGSHRGVQYRRRRSTPSPAQPRRRRPHSFNDPSREAGKEAAMTESSTLPDEPPATPLLSAEDVARVVDRIAHQLIEKAGPDLAGLVL